MTRSKDNLKDGTLHCKNVYCKNKECHQQAKTPCNAFKTTEETPKAIKETEIVEETANDVEVRTINEEDSNESPEKYENEITENVETPKIIVETFKAREKTSNFSNESSTISEKALNESVEKSEHVVTHTLEPFTIIEEAIEATEEAPQIVEETPNIVEENISIKESPVVKMKNVLTQTKESFNSIEETPKTSIISEKALNESVENSENVTHTLQPLMIKEEAIEATEEASQLVEETTNIVEENISVKEYPVKKLKNVRTQTKESFSSIEETPKTSIISEKNLDESVGKSENVVTIDETPEVIKQSGKMKGLDKSVEEPIQFTGTIEEKDNTNKDNESVAIEVKIFSSDDTSCLLGGLYCPNRENEVKDNVWDNTIAQNGSEDSQYDSEDNGEDTEDDAFTRCKKNWEKGVFALDELLEVCSRDPDSILRAYRKRHTQDQNLPCGKCFDRNDGTEGNYFSIKQTHGEIFGDPKYHYLMEDVQTSTTTLVEDTSPQHSIIKNKETNDSQLVAVKSENEIESGTGSEYSLLANGKTVSEENTESTNTINTTQAYNTTNVVENPVPVSNPSVPVSNKRPSNISWDTVTMNRYSVNDSGPISLRESTSIRPSMNDSLEKIILKATAKADKFRHGSSMKKNYSLLGDIVREEKIKYQDSIHSSGSDNKSAESTTATVPRRRCFGLLKGKSKKKEQGNPQDVENKVEEGTAPTSDDISETESRRRSGESSYRMRTSVIENPVFDEQIHRYLDNVSPTKPTRF